MNRTTARLKPISIDRFYHKVIENQTFDSSILE
jgi:hypothetical protein